MSASAKTDVRSFSELDAAQLYAILRLRSAVFVVEQNCAYQDLDGLDQAALHVTAVDARGLVAYTRLLPPGSPHEGACAIGRVVSAARARGEGRGRAVMRRSVRECRERWPGLDVVIHAQSYLLEFYGEFGFVAEGREYLEDGLPHYTMRLRAAES